MYLIGSLLIGLVITLYLVSKIASMLHAKKPGMERVFAASIAGMIAAVVTLIPLGLFVEGIDPNVMLILSVAIVFLVSSMAFKVINVMTWGGAITTNIANIVLSLIALTASVVLTGGSIDDTLRAVNNSVKENTGMIETVASGDTGSIHFEEANLDESQNQNTLAEAAIDEDYEPTFKEVDLLPAGTIRELKAKEKKVYKEPKYHVISISDIRSAVGKNIRILNNNGNSISGALKNIQGNDAVVEQRMGGGLAITPISFAKIRKLEVYR
jgi:hypothetical protein